MSTCYYNIIEMLTNETIHIFLFVMEEFRLDNAPSDCISCLRYSKTENILLVSSWDTVRLYVFILLNRLFRFMIR